MRSLTIISDPGVDDIIALVLLDKLTKGTPKTLVSTFGNVPFNFTDKNCRDFVAFAGKDWSYKSGSDVPLDTKLTADWAYNYHGPDGLWNVPIPVKDQIDKGNTMTDKSSLISLGPLTEVYKHVGIDYKDCLLMGGAFEAEGNETLAAEFNIAMDPLAAKKFFEAKKEFPVSVVPLDATNSVKWSADDVAKIPETSPSNKWLKQLLTAWFNDFGLSKQRPFVLYDPLAVYLYFYPEEGEWIESGIEALISVEQQGQTRLSAKNPSCRIATNVKRPEFVSGEIFNLIFNV